MVFKLMGFKVAVTEIELYALNFTSQMDVSCRSLSAPARVYVEE